MDTWSHGTKQSQTKPILTDLPLPAQQKTSLTFLLTKTYTTTPQSQKQSQTNPISPLASQYSLQCAGISGRAYSGFPSASSSRFMVKSIKHLTTIFQPQYRSIVIQSSAGPSALQPLLAVQQQLAGPLKDAESCFALRVSRLCPSSYKRRAHRQSWDDINGDFSDAKRFDSKTRGFVKLGLSIVCCGRNSVVERQLPKLKVVGSNPIARFSLSIVFISTCLPLQTCLLPQFCSKSASGVSLASVFLASLGPTSVPETSESMTCAAFALWSPSTWL